ncbi:gliding motility protein GldD [Parabacteroides sp. OttesenSCG-928-G21]|nr:gliding motility protein GldD [Parabacteroides sp. OttesenSCG-928-G21]
MKRIEYIFLLLISLSSCIDYTPKPRGYFRIELPEPQYTLLPDNKLPYAFELSNGITVELPPVTEPEGWINLFYPQLQAKIYCSYLPITPSSYKEVESENRSLVLRQARESDIIENEYVDAENKVYATLFEIEGNAASPVQFFITDSTTHFFRGALYFETKLNTDSLMPVINYVTYDIIHLIETFYWKN